MSRARISVLIYLAMCACFMAVLAWKGCTGNAPLHVEVPQDSTRLSEGEQAAQMFKNFYDGPKKQGNENE